MLFLCLGELVIGKYDFLCFGVGVFGCLENDKKLGRFYKKIFLKQYFSFFEIDFFLI